MNMIRSKERGGVLVIVPVALLLAVGLVVATLTLSTSNYGESTREVRRARAYYVAKAGLEQAVFDLKQATSNAVLVNAFAGIEQFHDKKTYLNCVRLQSDGQPALDPTTGLPVDARALLLNNGVELGGTFDVSVHIEGFDPLNPGAMGNSRRFVTIRSTGWVPDRNSPDAVSHTIETTVMIELTASEVFDYAYFINNWGWFYGDSIEANGNVRSNGQFDVGGTSAEVNGSPRFLGANGNDLFGYLDDNEDGLQDGLDGGIYAGWDIVGTENVQGMAGTLVAGDAINQHDFTDQVDMPNLTDLSLYEQHAISTNASINIGGTQVTDGVYGDDPGESGYLYLEGTQANPIVLNGTIVVRNGVIIKGYVTGQGVIYTGGNVYVADDITYVNGPTTTRPSGTTEADFESWLQTNQSADALGLFAREQVVLGDYTDNLWQSYVNTWMNDPANESVEDAGEDQIPNTIWGVDGIPNTTDDDPFEGDGQWEVETYSPLHQALGLIPPGSAIGDVIPGSGEDIDGDGQYDPAFQMSDVNLPVALSSGQWGGNLPSGVTNFNQVATRNIKNFDAALYTNHALAGLILAWGDTIRFNGSIVSRNEAIIYGADKLEINHDARLIGGGDNFGYFLPRSFRQIRFMKMWESVPNVHFDELAALNLTTP